MQLLFLVPAPRVKPERQMKEMEHRSGIFFSGLSVYVCIADQNRGSWSRSSSTAAVVAATSRQRRLRAPLWRVGLLFCVSVAERVLCASWLWAIHQQQRGFLLFTAAAYLLRCCCCDDHGRRREEDPSPSDWNTLPSEPSDPSHCLLERSTRSTRCRVANSITENTICLLYTSPSPRDKRQSRMPSSA